MLQLKFTDPASQKTEMLVIPVCEDTDIVDDPIVTATADRARQLKEFSGTGGDKIVLYSPPQFHAARVLLMGLGAVGKVKPETLRSLAGRAAGLGIKSKLSQMTIVVPSSENIHLDPEVILEAMLEGACLANHRFDQYRKEKDSKPLKRIHFCVKPQIGRRFRNLPGRVAAICRGTIQARNWVNIPSNDKKPAEFARTIMRLAKKERLKSKLMGKKELQQKKFGSILAVAAGSQAAPAMLILDHHPQGAKQTVALIGKGVTFDSGGLNLKSSTSLNLMKSDMAGAAAVAATMLTVARQQSGLRVVGIIPLVENMLSATATRPGDIIRSYSGKTVEIGNTDAEGRLILADAISYAVQKYRPQVLVDIATLTGACVMALGEGMAGLFSDDDELAQSIIQSGDKTHERCWRMPLPEDYKKLLKSELADINNMPKSRWGGAITAALFLSEFVAKTRWAHIDIAGPAYRKKGNDYCGPGATGFGVRLLCDILGKI
jgi:leucyl aminopeptidase